MNKGLNAGKLRHRITIEAPQHTQNPETGELVTSWVPVAANIAAAIEPLSGREYIAAAKERSTITARITIRYRADLTAAMRIQHGTTTYNLRAILPDARSGREWQTLLVEASQ